PGARALTSGATLPSGPSARRSNSSRAPCSPLRMHLRSGVWLPPSLSLGGFRNRVLPSLAVLVLEPVCAGGHDDLIALLVRQAIIGEQAASVLGPVGLALAALLGPLLLDQLVGGEIGE